MMNNWHPKIKGEIMILLLSLKLKYQKSIKKTNQTITKFFNYKNYYQYDMLLAFPSLALWKATILQSTNRSIDTKNPKL